MAITPITKYKCSDGKIFDTQAEANAHEALLVNVQVFDITYVDANWNTVRGYALANCRAKHLNFVEEYMYGHYGNRYGFRDEVHTNDQVFEAWTAKRSEKSIGDIVATDNVIFKIEEDLIPKVF